MSATSIVDRRTDYHVASAPTGPPPAPDMVWIPEGGSHLCAPNYCLRYRPAARQPQMIDTAMTHIGFRCIVRVKQEPR
jgi:hypothetical protein